MNNYVSWDTMLEEQAQLITDDPSYNDRLTVEDLKAILSPQLKTMENLELMNGRICSLVLSKGLNDEEITSISREIVGIIYDIFPSLHAIVESARNIRYELTKHEKVKSQEVLGIEAIILDHGTDIGLIPIYKCGRCGYVFPRGTLGIGMKSPMQCPECGTWNREPEKVGDQDD